MAEPRKPVGLTGYDGLHGDIVDLLEAARRAGYGERLIQRLAVDLTARFGRGFGADNLELMRLFYLTYQSLGQHFRITDSGIDGCPR